MVKTGLEALLEERPSRLKGARIALIANPASVDSRLNHSVDLFYARKDLRLMLILGPEHGARGEAQDQIEMEDSSDEATGLPVYSLYGKSLIPTAEMIRDVDTLVFDLQDVGSRYYTFIYTMAYAMQACARDGKRMVVLDRPNPISGIAVQGNILDLRYSSFVGLYPLAVRHGMTSGELALLINKEFHIQCRLEVVAMQGWRRSMWFDRTGLPWVNPSPNMPTLETATVYPGGCLIEATNLSEGRGTTRPFEFIGAPYVKPRPFVEKLEKERLRGVSFRPLYFQPVFNKWAGELCGGIQVHVTERELFDPFLTYIAIIRAASQLYPDRFEWRKPPYEYEREKLPIDILCGNSLVREQIEAGHSLKEIKMSWQKALSGFKKLRQKYLIYRK
ncbi:MAG TPA: DUF1343 domain-containing protein [Candidatus Binatia bacterium]|nr:DUF1343 domain-containing protein [Candidatus Binatia bacterium]